MSRDLGSSGDLRRDRDSMEEHSQNLGECPEISASREAEMATPPPNGGGGGGGPSVGIIIRFSHPKDKYNFIYSCLVLVGAGYLMPYNSFITCVDYLHSHYPDTPIEFILSFVYIIVSFFSVFLTNVFVKMVKTHTRILVGYILSLGPLIYVAVVHLWLKIFESGSLSLFSLLLSCATAGVGCSIQQSSFYGYCGMLPSRYVQAVMVGESLSGVIVSLNRICTKLLKSSQSFNTLVFFIVSIFLLVCCLALHQIVKRTEFSKFYSKSVESSCHFRQGTAAPENTNENPLDSRGSDANVSTASNEEAISGPDKLAVDVITESACESASFALGIDSTDVQQLLDPDSHPGLIADIREGFRTRAELMKTIYPYVITIMNTYLVTLLLFPGFETEVKASSTDRKSINGHPIDDSWLPILLVTLFNVTDLLGKVISSSASENTSKTFLVTCSFLRFLIVPPFLACIFPISSPLIPSFKVAALLTIALGLSNGYFGSAPMIIAPQTVPATGQNRELVGNIMTFFYFLGLTAGAAGAYVLTKVLHSMD